jgi:hypothetical protein
MNQVEALRQIAPKEDAANITPSDSTVVDYTKIYVGGIGNVVVTTRGGTDVTFTAVPTGTFIEDLRVVRVKAATTANLLVGYKAN